MGAYLENGKIYRCRKDIAPEPPELDGLPNYFHVTHTPGEKAAVMMGGINPFAPIEAPEGSRRPAILIRSGPHQAGTALTPWQDLFDIDQKWVNDELRKDYAVRSVHGWYRVLRTMMTDARYQLDLPRDPTARVSFPDADEPSGDNALSVEELGRLLQVFEAEAPQHYALVARLAYTGLRFAHAGALRWDDLDSSAALFSSGGGSSTVGLDEKRAAISNVVSLVETGSPQPRGDAMGSPPKT